MGFTCSPAFPSSRRQTVPRTEGRGAHASTGPLTRRVRDLGNVSVTRPPSACSLGACRDGGRFGRHVYLGQRDCRYGARRCRGVPEAYTRRASGQHCSRNHALAPSLAMRLLQPCHHPCARTLVGCSVRCLSFAGRHAPSLPVAPPVPLALLSQSRNRPVTCATSVNVPHPVKQS